MNALVNPALPTADLSKIKRMIPHRYPFLMIDKVVNLNAGVGAVGIKNVTCNEPHFEGHFPDNPVMPGVAVVEAMAQTAAVLVNQGEANIILQRETYADLLRQDRLPYRLQSHQTNDGR